jgi:hypothetical protein
MPGPVSRTPATRVLPGRAYELVARALTLGRWKSIALAYGDFLASVVGLVDTGLRCFLSGVRGLSHIANLPLLPSGGRAVTCPVCVRLPEAPTTCRPVHRRAVCPRCVGPTVHPPPEHLRAIEFLTMSRPAQVNEQPVNVRLPRELHEAVLDRAKAEDRSMAQEIRVAIRYYLQETKPLTTP